MKVVRFANSYNFALEVTNIHKKNDTQPLHTHQQPGSSTDRLCWRCCN